ncbi:MAG: hypothetical protein HWE27_18575 [Gammaproteobacteria bacterium]|nr:hypothetical protein [Gammaproteobacteria bacterium]
MNNELNQNGFRDLALEEISSVSGAGSIWEMPSEKDIRELHEEIVGAIVDAACAATGNC